MATAMDFMPRLKHSVLVRLFLLHALTANFSFAVEALVPRKVPELPVYAFLDESGKISAPMAQSIQRVLAEHSTLTGEPIFVAVFGAVSGPDFKDSGDEDFSSYSLRVFDQWKNSFGNRSDVILLAVDLKNHQGRIEVGYQVEPMLGEAKTRTILKDFLNPELVAGDPGRAVSLALMEILKSVESPLIASGEGLKILSAGGFKGAWQPIQSVQSETQRSWGLWFLLGLGLMIVAGIRVIDVEAHYTSRGWIRVRSWKVRFRKTKFGDGLLTGGGSCGSW